MENKEMSLDAAISYTGYNSEEVDTFLPNEKNRFSFKTKENKTTGVLERDVDGTSWYANEDHIIVIKDENGVTVKDVEISGWRKYHDNDICGLVVECIQTDTLEKNYSIIKEDGIKKVVCKTNKSSYRPGLCDSYGGARDIGSYDEEDLGETYAVVNSNYQLEDGISGLEFKTKEKTR